MRGRGGQTPIEPGTASVGRLPAPSRGHLIRPDDETWRNAASGPGRRSARR